jgi:hypothetical protein
MWIQSGSLMVQWIDKEISTAAIEKLKYTALEITDSDGHKVKGFCFLKPTTTSLPLDDGATTNVLVPHSIAAVCKLTIATTPSGWDLSTTDDSTVVLRHDPAIVRLEYDRKFSSVSIACTGINSVDPVHQLAALQTQLTTAQRQLEETKRQYDASPAQGTTVDGGPFGTRYYASARDGLGTEMQQEQEHIDKLQGWIDKAQKGLGTNSAVGPAPLEGVVASIVLPNGVEVARIALGSNLSK